MHDRLSDATKKRHGLRLPGSRSRVPLICGFGAANSENRSPATDVAVRFFSALPGPDDANKIGPIDLPSYLSQLAL